MELIDDVGDGKGDAPVLCAAAPILPVLPVLPVLRAARTVTSCQSSRKNYIDFKIKNKEFI